MIMVPHTLGVFPMDGTAVRPRVSSLGATVTSRQRCGMFLALRYR